MTKQADIRDFQSPFLTIGIPTYDDFNGAIFTIKNLQINHSHVMKHCEIILMDDNPGSSHGDLNKKIFQGNQVPGGRYIPVERWTGPWCKGKLIYEARGHASLIMDSHVLPVGLGVISKLIQYHLQNPDCNDILHGPLVYDNLTSVSTHFHPRWSGQMWGQWATDARGTDTTNPPFEIWAQGMGLFSVRTERWKEVGGFHPLLRGFGGEEGTIHEKFRKHGGKALCLPFLRWWHKFDDIVHGAVLDNGVPKLKLHKKPDVAPYPLSWENKVWNYTIELTNLGISCDQMIKHFAKWQPSEAIFNTYRQATQALAIFQRQYPDYPKGYVPGAKPHASSLSDADLQQISQISDVGGGGSSVVFDAGLSEQGTADLQRLLTTESIILSSLNQSVQPRR